MGRGARVCCLSSDTWGLSGGGDDNEATAVW